MAKDIDGFEELTFDQRVELICSKLINAERERMAEAVIAIYPQHKHDYD